jgi:4-alpha-glucanotransferase
VTTSPAFLPLYVLAETVGVRTAYRDSQGSLRTASPEALIGVLKALGINLSTPADAAEARRAWLDSRPVLEPVHVAWDGNLPLLHIRRKARIDHARLIAEGGAESTPGFDARGASDGTAIRLDVRLPAGVHALEMIGEGRSWKTRLIAAPSRLHDPGQRHGLGVFMPLHAFGSAPVGPGTYADLRTAADWAAAQGAAWLGTLPLLASLLDEPFEASPYAPASRLFWNEAFLVPKEHSGGPHDRERYVDYRSTAADLRRHLQTLADAFFSAGGETDEEFTRFVESHPRARDYARFRAACDRFRAGWPTWPARQRDGELRTGDIDTADERRHLYAAWKAEQHMAGLSAAGRAGTAARLYLDLPLGVHVDGYDAWREQRLFATGVSAGAPPDALFRGGQNWGFHPLLPDALRRDGYRYLRETLQHHLRHAGALRIDHVMSLGRLFWIADGLPATDGVYVRYPREEMFAIHMLEASRHDALLVGEDLGTVPAEIRGALESHGLLRMFVAQFEFSRTGDLPAPSPRVVTSLNTHDTPTFTGFWNGIDIDDQHGMGLLDDRRTAREHAARARLRQGLADQFGGATREDEAPGAGPVMRNLLRRLAASDARMLLVTL